MYMYTCTYKHTYTCTCIYISGYMYQVSFRGWGMAPAIPGSSFAILKLLDYHMGYSLAIHYSQKPKFCHPGESMFKWNPVYMYFCTCLSPVFVCHCVLLHLWQQITTHILCTFYIPYSNLCVYSVCVHTHRAQGSAHKESPNTITSLPHTHASIADHSTGRALHYGKPDWEVP